MKRSISILGSVVVLALAMGARGQDESRWKDYEPRTLKSLMDKIESEIESTKPDATKDEFFLSGDSYPSRVKLVYQAKTRALPEGKKKILEIWAKSMQRPEAKDAFPMEALFKEGKEEYWIAVQKPLVDPLSQEVKEGGSLNGYVVFMGTAKKVGKAREWLFAMNEFEAK